MLKKAYRPVISWALIFMLILALLPVYSTAAGGTASSNINTQNYSTYGSPVNSYLFKNADGTISRFEYISNSEWEYNDGEWIWISDDKIIVEQYDDNFNCVSTSEIAMELTTFGGFYSGTEYNFVVFGQNNLEENNSLEVFRVVKYNKSWQRLGSVGLFDCNTTIPFDAGSLRMTEYGNMLYIRSAHEMYASANDGLNHQSNITFSVSIPDMRITDSFSRVMNTSYGYVSHSFNQFILTAGNTLAAVDHGDAYPRSVALLIYNKPAGEEQFITGGRADYINLLPIEGATGANATGVSLGGFEASDTSYIVTGNSIIQDSDYQSRRTRNIFISTASISTPSTETVQVKWLTNHEENGQVTTSTPHLVKINANSFVVLWTEGNTVKYVLIDGNGDVKTSVQSLPGALSDCKPIMVNNSIVWYVTNNSAPVFYEIGLDAFLLTQNITVSGLSNKTYGDAPFSLTVTPDASAQLNNFSFSSSDTSTAEIDADGRITVKKAGTTTITVTEPGNHAYKPFTWSQQLTVGKAGITVTADNKTKKTGNADPVLTYSITSGNLIGNDNFTGALTRAAGETAGTYAINQGTLALNTNYNVTFIPGEFTIVDKEPQNITITGLEDKTYGDAPFTLSVTPDSTAQLEDFTFISGNTDVAEINSEGQITVKNSGTATITVTEPGDDVFAPFAWTRQLVVNKKAIDIIEVETANKTYDGTPDATVNSVEFDGLLDGEALSIDTDFAASGIFTNTDAGDGRTVIVTVTLLDTPTSNNYKLFEDSFETTGNVAKAEIEQIPAQTVQIYFEEPTTGNTVNLGELLPADKGAVSYEIESAGTYIVGAEVISGILSFDTEAAEAGETAEIVVEAVMNNYENTLITITVEFTDKKTPVVTPSVSGNMNYGQPLSTLTLTATAIIDGTVEVPGVIVWDNPTDKPSVGAAAQAWTFTPDNTELYNVVNGSSAITVNKTEPSGTPTITKLTSSGKTLGDANLTAPTGGFKNPHDNSVVTGALVWESGDSTTVNANSSYVWKFSPEDTVNYTSITGTFVPFEYSGGPGGGGGGGGSSTTLASLSPAEAAFDKTAPKDIVVTLTRGDYTFNSIKNSGYTLVSGTDYTVNGTIYTIKASYLSKLDEGTVTLTFDMSGGTDPSLKIKISGEPEKPEPTLTPVSNPFADVNANEWYYTDVMWAYENGLFAGTGDAEFSPNMPMTRAMLVTVLARLHKTDLSAYNVSSFNDVENGTWYTSAIEWAKVNGLVSGTGGNNFSPNVEITRQDLAVILMRYAVFTGKQITPGTTQFSDNAEISDYAKDAVACLNNAGVINGKPGNVFDPLANATRAEVAAMLHRYVQTKT